jgi:hypothetical protein
MAYKAAADWAMFVTKLAQEGVDANVIKTEKMLCEVLDDVWSDASELTKSRVMTHWKNNIQDTAPPSEIVKSV